MNQRVFAKLAMIAPPALVGAARAALELATVTFPFVVSEESRVIGSRFAAIHTDPPALEPGKTPAVVVNQFGTGRPVWKLFLSLPRQVMTPPFAVETDTHPSVEAVVFHEPREIRLLASLLGFPQELPRIGVSDNVRLNVPDRGTVEGSVRLPSRSAGSFESAGPRAQFRVEPFDTFAMLPLEYA